MALITVDLLLALTIGCATVCGHDALAEMEKRIAVVLDNQQKLFGDLDEVLHGLNDAQAQFTCHYGQCKIQANCTVDALSYSGYGDAKCTHRYGYLKLNQQLIWKSEWCKDGAPRGPDRGLAIFLLDPFKCSVPATQVFDTHQDESEALELISFLDEVPTGTVIVGITADEAVYYLSKALPALSKIGVEVSDVQYRGSFGFIAQKGFPKKTMFDKGLTEEESDINPANFIATLTGTSVDDLEIEFDDDASPRTLP